MRIAIVSQVFDAVAPDALNSVGLVTHHLAAGLAATDDVAVYASLDCRGNRGAWTGADGVEYRLMPPSRRDQLVSRAWPHASRLAGAARSGRRPPFSTSALAGRAYGEAVARDLAARPVDVVHVQHATQLLPSVRRAAPAALLVLHAHAEWFPQSPAPVLAGRLAVADLVVACSDHVRDRIAAYVPSVADRCVTVHNGVDTTAFDHLGAPPADLAARPFVLALGAVSPHKGVHDTVAAFCDATAGRPDVDLRIVGPPGAYPLEEAFPLDDRATVTAVRALHRGDYRRQLDELVPPDLAGRVHFAGRIDRRLVLHHLRSASVAVMASIWDEGFGLPALEALAAGTPVVATRSGGVPEFVLDGVTGRLVDKGDRSALGHALAALLDDPAERRRLGGNGAALARDRFAWPVVVDRLRQAYAGALVA